MPRSRWPRSLRFRLMFWNTMAIALLLVLTLVGVRTGLRLTLESELDRLLRNDASEVLLIVERFQPDWSAVDDELNRKARSHSDNGWFGRVIVDDQVLAATHNAPVILIPPIGQPLFTVGRHRMCARTGSIGVSRATIVVGTDYAFVDEDVDRLTSMLVLAGTFVSLITPLIGWWLAGRATQPVAEIIDTAQRLHPERLEERLPVRGTGDELDRLSETINDRLDAINDYLDRQREFVANSAHELRSPLTAVRTAVEVALERDRSPEEYRELLGELAERCQGLSDLINRLLLLAEGDGEALGPGTTTADLGHVARLSVEMFQTVAEQKNVQLLSEIAPAVVRGEPTHLAQIVNNLIDNALKFTPAGGIVSVRVSAQNGTAHLTVADTGPGIPRSDLPRVFDRFFTGDRSRQRDGRPGGTGLGLSICRAITERYGGQIELRANSAGGTTAAISLPLAVHLPASRQ
ncbi:MAG: HAMP domain-containing histidine kinase [Gemmataceae bacterium]|nr:HAMP domain-containing histidine kinase [Gemmataceae bacterium]